MLRCPKCGCQPKSSDDIVSLHALVKHMEARCFKPGKYSSDIFTALRYQLKSERVREVI